MLGRLFGIGLSVVLLCGIGLVGLWLVDAVMSGPPPTPAPVVVEERTENQELTFNDNCYVNCASARDGNASVGSSGAFWPLLATLPILALGVLIGGFVAVGTKFMEE